MSMQAYEFTPEMSEISGFGGSYEEACRAMLIAGLSFWDEQGEDFDPNYKVPKGETEEGASVEFYGVLFDSNEDAKALDKAIMDATITDEETGEERRVGDGATGAMHQAVVSSIFFIRENGWDRYVEEMSKPEPAPSGDYGRFLNRERPYGGQSHTHAGERGSFDVRGAPERITIRDVADCYWIGMFHASGLPESEYPESVDDLPIEDMDRLAVVQNATVELEKRMGVFPNVPKLVEADENEAIGEDS